MPIHGSTSSGSSCGRAGDRRRRTTAPSSVPSNFRTAIQTRLDTIGSTLTPDDIVTRAQANSCGGCHSRNTFGDAAQLGGGLVFPASQGFTHVAEFTENGPEGPRFAISNALTEVFLPFRETLLEAFLSSAPPNAVFVAQSLPLGVIFPLGHATVSVTMRNAGTSPWTAAEGFALASESPTDTMQWGLNRVPLAPGEVVLPGQTKTFTFTIRASKLVGVYAFQWRMISAGTRFGMPSDLAHIVVDTGNDCCSGSSVFECIDVWCPPVETE